MLSFICEMYTLVYSFKFAIVILPRKWCIFVVCVAGCKGCGLGSNVVTFGYHCPVINDIQESAQSLRTRKLFTGVSRAITNQ